PSGSASPGAKVSEYVPVDLDTVRVTASASEVQGEEGDDTDAGTQLAGEAADEDVLAQDADGSEASGCDQDGDDEAELDVGTSVNIRRPSGDAAAEPSAPGRPSKSHKAARRGTSLGGSGTAPPGELTAGRRGSIRVVAAAVRLTGSELDLLTAATGAFRGGRADATWRFLARERAGAVRLAGPGGSLAPAFGAELDAAEGAAAAAAAAAA
ncbi:hypothetical protein HK405_015356, partial [Cladochytrium tenue]